MVLCPAKRKGKRKRKESAESASALSNFRLEYLSDDLLIEILRRLPTAKSAVGLMLVSKRWFSLISTPYFRSQFITHHINIDNNNHYHAAYQFTTRSAVFIDPPRNRQQGNELFFITGNDPLFKSPGFTLEFLPEKSEFVSVVATCNDSMLCRARKEGCVTNYYVCNPFTMKWLLLPPLPTSDSRDDINFGLVYQPNYQRWIQGINESRFRVVSIEWTERDPPVSMRIYCSETRQWNEPSLPSAEYWVCSNIVANDGKLHWHNGYDVVAHDPFDNETFYMAVSDSQAKVKGGERFGTFCLGICQGFLRVMKFVTDIRGIANHLSVWELEDSKARCLILKHRIYFSGESSLVHHSLHVKDPVAFHPNDMNVVYLQLRDKRIIKCKIQRGKLQVVGKSLYPRMWTSKMDVLTTLLPWWPTPVQMLPQNSHD